MTTPLVYADWANKKNQLIRKALTGSVFIADYSVAAITTLTEGAGSGLSTLPTGYDDAGFMTTDGVSMSESVDQSEIDSWGSLDPTRTDIKKETTTAKIVLQETKALTIGLYTGADTSTVTADATTGEVSIAKPIAPSARFYRLLSLAVDNTADGELYVARFLPRVKVTDKDDQAYSEADEAITWGVTFTAYLDAVLGYSEKFLFGGPGWMALAADHGFTAGA